MSTARADHHRDRSARRGYGHARRWHAGHQRAVLTAQLAGLQFDAPADQLAATTTSFTYSVSDGTTTVNAGTTINVTPINDAPVASSSTITVAEESVNTPLGLAAPTDIDGN